MRTWISEIPTREGKNMIRLPMAPVALILFALVACSGGDSGQTAGNNGNAWGGGDDLGQGSDGTVSDGDVVAVIRVQSTEAESQLVQATLPVPRGTLTDNGLSVPLSIRDEQGNATPTQVEIVSRYPRWEDGADVVEVLAHVRRPEGLEPGEPFDLELGINPHSKKDLIIGQGAANLLNSPGAFKLVARDVFGNSYSADLLAGWNIQPGENEEELREATRVVRDGQVVRTVASHSILLPSIPQGGSEATLPHMFGVHSYASAWRGKNFISLDLHVHNGLDGLDSADERDDALQALHFKDLKLRTPPGWEVAALIENPQHGDSVDAGGWRWHKLVGGRADGKLHYFPKQGRMLRRLVVYPSSAESDALAMLHNHNRGFSKPTSVPNGNQGWSWWNQQTARYLAQNSRLPELEHLSMSNLRDQQAARWSELLHLVETGSSGNYPFEAEGMGWAHPWGVGYGGMAGGDEIWPFDGVLLAWTGSREAYSTAQLQARGYADRQPQALYDLAGRPTSLEDLLVQGPEGPYVRCWFYERPNSGSDVFGFNDAPTHQTDWVVAQNKQPPYEDELSGWMHIDHQHLIRYTRNLKTLAWLGNDAMAKDLLWSAAENERLSYHPYPVTSSYEIQSTQMINRMQYVQQYPGQGFDMRRSECWGMDAAICNYALSNQERRDILRPWFGQTVDLIDAGQSTCSGNIMSSAIGIVFGQDYRTRQTFEESFATTLLRSFSTSVFAGVDEERFQKAQNSIIASATCTVTPPFWNDNEGKPAFHVGVGPWNPGEGEFCFGIPGDAFSGYHDSTNPLPMMAWATLASEDDLFTLKSSMMLGGGDLRARLEAKGTTDIAHWAPLLAISQLAPMN